MLLKHGFHRTGRQLLCKEPAWHVRDPKARQYGGTDILGVIGANARFGTDRHQTLRAVEPPMPRASFKRKGDARMAVQILRRLRFATFGKIKRRRQRNKMAS